MPCLVGIFLAVEADIAGRRLPPEALEKVKNTTSYTLSAIGDSVFAGSLLIFWALLTSCLLLIGQRILPFGIGLFFFLGLQGFRVYTFLGASAGFSFLSALKRWDLINWGRRIKFVNAALLLWLWALLFPAGDRAAWGWGMGASALPGCFPYGLGVAPLGACRGRAGRPGGRTLADAAHERLAPFGMPPT